MQRPCRGCTRRIGPAAGGLGATSCRSVSSAGRGARPPAGKEGDSTAAAGVRLRLLRVAGASLVLATTTGCQGPQQAEPDSLPEPHLNVHSVTVTVAAGANDGWPARVELVRVETVKAMDELLAIDNGGWFGEAGAEFRLRNAHARVDAWEAVPGTTVGPFDVKQRGRFHGVLFCGAATGVPVRFERSGDATVFIDDTGCTIASECVPVSTLRRLFRVSLPGGACSRRVRPVWTRTVTLVAAEQVNDNRPVPVEMVRVAYEDTLSELLKITPRQWFESESERFHRVHSQARRRSWEVVPGTEIGPLNVRVSGRGLDGALFCGTPEATAPVRLAEGDIVVRVRDGGCLVETREQTSPFKTIRDFFERLRRLSPW